MCYEDDGDSYPMFPCKTKARLKTEAFLFYLWVVLLSTVGVTGVVAIVLVAFREIVATFGSN